jgi:dinuclear metal center protein, YbgI/SA1388 family
MKVREVAVRMEERIPRAWSEDWDNVGLLLGDPDAEVTKIAVSLDATEDTVREAASRGCGMLLVHHPAIFRPLKRLVHPSPVARMVEASVRHGVSVYSAHTNWDSSPEGVNVVLSRLLGLANITPILPPHDGAWGMGAIGDLPAGMCLRSFAEAAKGAWGLSSLMIYGDETTPFSRVALCGGAGGDLLHAVLEMGADVFVTADVSYHYLLDAQLMKTRLVVVNHGEMERASLPDLCEAIREATGLETVLLDHRNWRPVVV